MQTLCTADVLVVGGGPAGIGAAIGSARTGADTLLLERHAFLGGIGSFSVGMPINQMRPFGEPRSQVHELLIAKLDVYGERAVLRRGHRMNCNVEYLKVAAFDALDEVNCRYLVHAQVVDSLTDEGRVCGVVVATKEGLRKVEAKCVVDCTGDADVACFAGADTMKAEGELSPMTLCVNMSSSDVEAAVEAWREVGPTAIEASRSERPLPAPHWNASRFAAQHSFYINHAGTRELGEFDGTKLEDLTRAETLSRRQVIQMLDTMRASGHDALEDLEIITAGAQVGVRETRRVKGGYVLTEDDALSGRAFDDAIAWRSGMLDIGFVRYEKMKVHDVPYRAIVPEKVDGLLVAGRCISATHVAASAGKSMGNCVATGHAAGIAASMSAERGVPPRELPVDEVRGALNADGVRFDLAGDAQEGLRG